MRVSAVAFDLDNTLWDAEPVIARAEQLLQAWLLEHCPKITQRVSPEEMRLARQRLALAEPHRAHDFTYLRIASLTKHARECGYEDAIAERAFEVFFAARNQVEVYPEVRRSLERLRSRFKLASLSNGNADLGRIGLAPLFEFSLSSREVGVAKPHPGGFTEIASRLALPPGQILYVGDDPVFDVQAARAAGMRTAWMNRRDLQWPAQIAAADLVVRDCAELASALGV